MGLHYSSLIDAPLAEVFAWHERPGALPRLLPPWQPIKVAQQAQSLVDGRAVLQLPGHVRWVAQHSGDDPPHRFVDELVSLPLHWRHTHSFEALDGGGTRVIDDVETPVPGSFLRQTFRYRHHQLAGDLAAHRDAAQRGGPLLAVAVTGSSGLIGSALCAYLSTGGHRVIRLVRRAPRDPSERAWDPERPDPARAGGHRRRRASRRGVHRRPLFRRPQAAGARKPSRPHGRARQGHGHHAGWTADPCVRVGHRFLRERAWRRTVTEESGRGSGFLAEVVEAWEAAAQAAADAGVRVVHVRTGIVQSARGASLKLLRPLFSVGLGGPLLSGIAMGVMDRSRRSARCLWAGARRPRSGRPAQRGGARSGHQRRIRLDTGSRHATASVAHGPGVRPPDAPGCRGRARNGAGESARRSGPARGSRARLSPPFARDVPAPPAGSHCGRALRGGMGIS